MAHLPTSRRLSIYPSPALSICNSLVDLISKLKHASGIEFVFIQAGKLQETQDGLVVAGSCAPVVLRLRGRNRREQNHCG